MVRSLLVEPFAKQIRIRLHVFKPSARATFVIRNTLSLDWGTCDKCHLSLISNTDFIFFSLVPAVNVDERRPSASINDLQVLKTAPKQCMRCKLNAAHWQNTLQTVCQHKTAWTEHLLYELWGNDLTQIKSIKLWLHNVSWNDEVPNMAIWWCFVCNAKKIVLCLSCRGT